MNVPRLMTLFHLSFTVLGIVALLLMATGILMLDWLIVGIIIVAIVLNALFSRLWHEETRAKISETPPKATPIETNRTFPMISLIASVYGQEQDINQIVKNLFKLASDYRGPSEIIVVDDGSLDNTYESAWTSIGLMHKELPSIRARVIKHLAHLGTTEATKTGANKATGEFLAILDPTIPSDFSSLNQLVDTASSTEKAVASPDKSRLQLEGTTEESRPIRLYGAESFRNTLNEK